jgi:hypothetical protein
MTPSRKHPSAAFWATVVVVVVLVAYPLSIGPAYWLMMQQATRGDPQKAIQTGQLLSAIYAPLAWTEDRGPQWWKRAIDEYLILWGKERI